GCNSFFMCSTSFIKVKVYNFIIFILLHIGLLYQYIQLIARKAIQFYTVLSLSLFVFISSSIDCKNSTLSLVFFKRRRKRSMKSLESRIVLRIIHIFSS